MILILVVNRGRSRCLLHVSRSWSQIPTPALHPHRHRTLTYTCTLTASRAEPNRAIGIRAFYPQREREIRPTCHPGDAVRARHASPAAARRAPCAGKEEAESPRRIRPSSSPLSAVFFTSTCLCPPEENRTWSRPGVLDQLVPGRPGSACCLYQLIQIYNSNDILLPMCSRARARAHTAELRPRSEPGRDQTGSRFWSKEKHTVNLYCNQLFNMKTIETCDISRGVKRNVLMFFSRCEERLKMTEIITE